MAGTKFSCNLESGQCTFTCSNRALWIVAFVCSLLILVETWITWGWLTQLGRETHLETGRHVYIYQPVFGVHNVSRDSNGCSCINHRSRQLMNLTAGQPLTDAECPKSKNATYFAPGSNSKHLVRILTGSVYKDGQIAEVFKGSKTRADDRVIIIKTHKSSGVDNITFDNVVLLIRRPNEAIASYFNHNKSGSHINNVKPTAYNSKDWTSFANDKIPIWRMFYLSYLNEYKGRLMLLSYARLKSDFLNEVCRLGAFLNVTISYETLWCVSKHREGKFHRKSNVDYVGVYTSDQMDRLNSALLEVRQAIARRFGNNALDDMF